VKPIPLREILEFGFARWNVNEVLPFIDKLDAP
jgi:hypothetical protein